MRGFVTGLLGCTLLASAAVAQTGKTATADPYAARVARILKATPLIDGHNDWAESLRERDGQKRWTMDLRRGLDRAPIPYNTDIEKLRKGGVGGQFWSVYVDAGLPTDQQVVETLEQIDLVKFIAAKYPADFALARTAADVRRIHAQGKIASLLGAEGGGQIDNSLSVLRTYADLGVGYLTLTHSKTIDWADSATDTPRHGGLTPFGEAVVREMNRLNMLVDLSHVSEDTMKDAMRVSRAPVIFSHSGARSVSDHPRNVSDESLRLLAKNGGVVMVNYAVIYSTEAYRQWAAAENAEKARFGTPPFGGLYIGQPEKAAAALEAWRKANPRPKVTMDDIIQHIEHVVKVAGIDHVGLGSDFDGVGNNLPDGLRDASTYPALLAALLKRGWSDRDVAKLAGENVLRVMAAAEKVAAEMKNTPPETRACEKSGC